jgi:hypothetical protein
MIKENFIKLYENSFKENWDLPCFTDYGENTTYTYGEVAKEIANFTSYFTIAALDEEIKLPLLEKTIPAGV